MGAAGHSCSVPRPARDDCFAVLLLLVQTRARIALGGMPRGFLAAADPQADVHVYVPDCDAP